MTDWMARTATGHYALAVAEDVLHHLDRICASAGAVETGGILIGHYSSDLSQAYVTEATSAPRDSKQGRSWFLRGVGELRELLLRRWHARERTHYVGEWHYHPAGQVVPSPTDFAQMLDIARAEQYRCAEPLLIIYGRAITPRDRVMRAFVCPARGTPEEFLCVAHPQPVATRPHKTGKNR